MKPEALKSWGSFFEFLKRRFFDIRYGHSMVGIVLSFVNFAVLSYNFVILKVPILSELFSHLWMFAVLFFFVYSPIALWVGYWYRTRQLPAEHILAYERHPLWARTMRVILEASEGKATKDDIEAVRKMLSEIEKGISRHPVASQA